MLDVHAPDHRIGGTKDFVIHLLTITAGLLIAIGLEQSVEAIHHHHQRKEAEKLIREEIQANQQNIQNEAQGLATEIKGMTTALQLLEAISSGAPRPVDANGNPLKLNEKELEFREGPMRDSAWRTASTTGVLSYMDYSEVENFAEAYKEQDQLQGMEALALNDYLQLAPILHGTGGDMDAARAKEALPYARNAMGHLSGMYFIGKGTLDAYAGVLK